MLPTNAYEKLYFRFSLLHTLQLQLNSSLYQQFYLLSNPVWHCQINPSLTSTSVLFPRNKNSPKVLIPTKTCPIFQTGKDAFKQLFHANYHTLIQVVISTSEIDTSCYQNRGDFPFLIHPAHGYPIDLLNAIPIYVNSYSETFHDYP